MVRIDSKDSLNGYLLKIRFKQWGKLWTFGNIRLHSARTATRLENRDYKVGKIIQHLIMPVPARKFFTQKRYSFKKRLAQAVPPSRERPSSFMFECFNPNERLIQVSLTVRSSIPGHKIPFQALLDVKPGFNRIRIPFRDIESIVPLQNSFHIELIPNEVPDGTTLYFGIIDFVSEKTTPGENAPQTPKVKCVVWDLDNTLWDGTLVEDGAPKLRLKPGIRRVIEELDRRGILQSIASKNNESDAMAVLKSWKLDGYFLFPQISWQPKNESIVAIVQQLNIGVDTILFIDDSPFELELVRASFPEVRLLRADEYSGLLSRPEFRVPVTKESSSRRKLYQLESQRQQMAQSFGQDYMAFLKHCAIRVSLSPMIEGNLERVHELTQRTNQMNFSGNRYDRPQLAKILQSPHLDTYVINCEDKFGSYGVVGFAIVDNREPRLTDLMFSCRIQAKKVEHAFLSFVIKKYTSEEKTDFYANYRRTPRNEPSGKAFAEMGFAESAKVEGVSQLVISRNRVAADDGIIQLVDNSDVVPL
jgi:FkbH-like protein